MHIVIFVVSEITRSVTRGVTHRVPTAPGKLGKMTTVFPVLEKYWNFIILLKILEKWE